MRVCSRQCKRVQLRQSQWYVGKPLQYRVYAARRALKNMPTTMQMAMHGLSTLPNVQHVLQRQHGPRQIVITRRGRQGDQAVDLRGEADCPRQLGAVLGQPADQLRADAALQGSDTACCCSPTGSEQTTLPDVMWQAIKLGAPSIACFATQSGLRQNLC